MLLVMPVLAMLAANLLSLRHATEVVLVALAISPVPPLLPKRQAKGGGEQSYGLGLMAWCALLSIVVIPIWVTFLGRFFGHTFVVSPRTIASVILTAAIAPLLAGMMVRALLPALANRLAHPVQQIATVLLPLAVTAMLAGAWRPLWEAVGDGTILALATFIVAGLAVGHMFGGPHPEHSVVLALSTACRHPAIALAIASSNFPGERFGGTILLYLILNALLGLPYLAWQRRRQSAAAGLTA